jgi:hypothetical protein
MVDIAAPFVSFVVFGEFSQRTDDTRRWAAKYPRTNSLCKRLFFA